MPNDDKKEDHNTGVSDDIKNVFSRKLSQKYFKKCLIKNLKNLVKNLKNGALSCLKKYFIKKILYQ